MPFYVINTHLKQPVTHIDGTTPRLYATGNSAAVMASRYTAETGIKHIPRPAIMDSAWREREAERFNNKTYQRLTWENKSWWRHGLLKDKIDDLFPHVALGKVSRVAFTESEEKGVQDIQSRLSPRKFLKQYFHNVLVDQENIEYWAKQFSERYDSCEVKFARTRDEITWVYTNGPHSCMSGTNHNSYHIMKVHPTAAYSGPDLALAYVEKDGGMGSPRGRASARVLVWPEKKLFGRFYGEAGKLKRALEEMGYKDGRDQTDLDAWNGARLTAIHGTNYKTRYVAMPYLDVGYYGYLDDNEEYIVIDRKVGGPIHTQGSVLAIQKYPCGHTNIAGGVVFDSTTRERHKNMCYKCLRDKAYLCVVTGAFFRNDVPYVELHDGRRVSKGYATSHTRNCDGNGKRYLRSDMYTLDTGEVWSMEYFQTHGKKCSYCAAPMKKESENRRCRSCR